MEDIEIFADEALSIEITCGKPIPPYEDQIDSEYAYEVCNKDMTLEVVLPKDDELLIDIDDEAGLAMFDRNLKRVKDYVGVIDWTEKPSRSGKEGRKHITVRLSRDVEPMERILLQAVLGSDLRRELLSYCRITIEDPHPTLFIEKKLAGLLTAGEPCDHGNATHASVENCGCQ